MKLLQFALIAAVIVTESTLHATSLVFEEVTAVELADDDSAYIADILINSTYLFALAGQPVGTEGSIIENLFSLENVAFQEQITSLQFDPVRQTVLVTFYETGRSTPAAVTVASLHDLTNVVLSGYSGMNTYESVAASLSAGFASFEFAKTDLTNPSAPRTTLEVGSADPSTIFTPQSAAFEVSSLASVPQIVYTQLPSLQVASTADWAVAFAFGPTTGSVAMAYLVFPVNQSLADNIDVAFQTIGSTDWDGGDYAVWLSEAFAYVAYYSDHGLILLRANLTTKFYGVALDFEELVGEPDTPLTPGVQNRGDQTLRRVEFLPVDDSSAQLIFLAATEDSSVASLSSVLLNESAAAIVNFTARTIIGTVDSNWLGFSSSRFESTTLLAWNQNNSSIGTMFVCSNVTYYSVISRNGDLSQGDAGSLGTAVATECNSSSGAIVSALNKTASEVHLASWVVGLSSGPPIKPPPKSSGAISFIPSMYVAIIIAFWFAVEHL